jgi:hypothetical protein
MTRVQAALSIARGNIAPTPTEDRGPIMTAPEVAITVCGGRKSARWVIEHAGPVIGSKPGREWFFYEREARQWWADYLATGMRRAS